MAAAPDTSQPSRVTVRRTTRRRDPAREAPPAERLVAGRYRLLAELGRGGMATVHRAEDITLGRTVALKLLHPQLARDAAFAQRFLDMERRVAQLSHPHLVTVYDTGECARPQRGIQGAEGRSLGRLPEEAICFAVMEELPGGSLKQALETRPRLPAERVRRIGVQLASALDHLHTHGIIHGDVKPSNVLLTESGDAKLADFGVSLDSDSAHSTLSPSGTAAYLAPEQVEGHPPGARADVYALGLVLYEALAGRPAFTGDTAVATAAQRLVRDPASLTSLRPAPPRALVDVITCALARDPDQRFLTAAALRDALETADTTTTTLEQDATSDTTLVIPTLPRHRSLPAADETTSVLTAPSRAAPDLRSSIEPRLHQHESVIADMAHARTRLPDVVHTAWRDWTASRSPLTLFERRVLAGLLALTFVVLTVFLPRALYPPAAPAVPHLINRSLGEAETALHRRGLRLGEVRLEPQEGRRAGTVVAQDPVTGSRVDRGATVHVTISVPPPPTPPSS